jgi:hypothetical protein
MWVIISRSFGFLAPKDFKIFGFQIFWPSVYLVKNTPEIRCAPLIWYLRFYYRNQYLSLVITIIITIIIIIIVIIIIIIIIIISNIILISE